ncbi:disease resistance protein At4g27190-like [Castanea sativa]|uniref:disease resistance protein At4g27190-like n=1 Tax=Castanea sativa TaxID=21020 RepID=UPI003F64C92A
MDVVSVIATIGGYFVGPIKKHCGYLFHYNSNIKDLKGKIQKLCDKREGVQLEIGAANRNGQVIAPEVGTWIEKVRNILDEDVEANKISLDGWCPRYYLSRNAKKKTLEIDGLLSEAAPFAPRVSYPPLLGIGSSSIEGIMDFESRKKMRKEVWEALRTDKVNMIAICGMGGIGKTTMAKEVAKRAKDDKLFDEVVMVVVSQNQDLRNIQVHIAEMLGLQLVEENPLVRAERLNNRLSMDSKSVLVILDDVWDALDLEAVGIPNGGQHNICKILLTSRSEEACTLMKTQKIFPINVLSEEEARNLFKEIAGNCIDTPGLHPIAKEVAKECGGLPIAIVTVGRALENKSEFEWSAALQQLKNAIPKNISGLDSKVYSSIELSYSYLKSDEAKSCFLLCCLFPEDYDILIEFLVRYGVGQRLFAKIDTVAEARNRVHAIFKNLKRSFLLLDSEEGEICVKMHDVVRDVAISIAENQGFLVRINETMEEWPEKDSCECSTAISLVSKELKRHPDGLECPKLELLQLLSVSDTLQMLPPNLFKGMKGLKVLFLFGMSFPSLPQSINVLQNLRTLQFLNCEITDASAIGELRKLEILCFLDSKIKELPGEMRNLSYLKFLELTECNDLERIPPNLLSSLFHLEELCMFGVHRVDWEPMEGNKEEEGANASLTELMSLSYLVALKIQIPNIKVLPKDLAFKNETIKFQIFSGDNKEIDEHNFTGYYDYLIKNSLGLASCDVSDIAERRMLLQLLKKSEILKLKEIKNLKNIVYELDKEGFQCLKVLEVCDSDDVEYVMDATSNQNPRVAFPTLESLELVGLPHLKEIYHSQFLERSFSRVCFGNLKSLRLRTLPRLIGFCTGVGPVELVQPSLNREVGRIGTDEVTNLEKHKMTDIQQHTGPFLELTPIIYYKLFSSNTILWAPNLENLELGGADSLEVVFDLEGPKANTDHQRIAVLAQLKTLKLRNLSELRYVWKNVPLGIQGFQKLTSIEVSYCHRLRYLFPTSIAKLLVQLQSIVIYDCDAIENIVQRDGEEEATDNILFPRVSSLRLRNLPNMMSFCIEAYSFEWSSIKEIDLEDCPKLKTIGSEIQSKRKSKKINGELDSRPNEHELRSPGFLRRCLECVPRRKNYGLMAVSDQGTTNKSQRSYSVNKEDTLSKPTDPKVSDSDNPSEIWSLFPSHIIECLKNLESIVLVALPSPEVLFQLEELNVEESHMAPVLDQLRKLYLDDLPKLMHIWKKGPERILGFGNLRSLDVWSCDSLTYLFSPSIAKFLVMLEKIEVHHCEKIEEILARAGEEEKEKDVLFDKVNSIVLNNLPNLKCFCSETNALVWPSLEDITVKECPSLSTFIPSNLNTPKLEGVYDALSWQGERTCHWKGDLNATIEYIFKGEEKQANHETQQEEQIETTEKNM